MENTLIGLYERTLNNCKFYEKENNKICLINEIGCLRGIAYCLEIAGQCPHDNDFFHFIDLQEKLKREG